MFKLLTLLIIFSFTQQAIADSLYLVVNGKAFHDKKKNYNEDSWGLGFEYNFHEKDKWIYFINGGFFKDSRYNRSNYFGGGLKRRFQLTDDKNSWHFDAGITAFFMTRKDYRNGDPFFAVLPYISMGTRKVAINAT